MADATAPFLAGHARHDPLRAAEAVDRGAKPSAVLSLCGRCAALYADLVALTAALPLAARPVRERTFILSPADARRLRPGGWRGTWSRIGSARDTFTRPLALGFTSLGLVGLLLTAAPALAPMAGAASGEGRTVGIETYAVAASAPAVGSPGPYGVDTSNPPREAAVAGPIPAYPSSTLGLSLGLLVAGGGLFAVRRIAAHGRRVR